MTPSLKYDCPSERVQRLCAVSGCDVGVMESVASYQFHLVNQIKLAGAEAMAAAAAAAAANKHMTAAGACAAACVSLDLELT
jgi:hypothetical protein